MLHTLATVTIQMHGDNKHDLDDWMMCKLFEPDEDAVTMSYTYTDDAAAFPSPYTIRMLHSLHSFGLNYTIAVNYNNYATKPPVYV